MPLLNRVRLTASVSSRRGDDLPGVDPAKGARLPTSEDNAGLVRSFCTALKPPAAPGGGRLSGGHAASGRSHPPPPLLRARVAGSLQRSRSTSRAAAVRVLRLRVAWALAETTGLSTRMR